MNKKQLFVTLTFLLLSFIFSIQSFAQSKETTAQESLPPGDWSIVFHPYLGPDYLNAPVLVHSVSAKSGAAERFEIQNVSNKAVKSIKVGWTVYENQDRSKILRQGETRLLRFHNELPPGRMGFIKFRVVSFTDFYRFFLVNGRLNKNLDVDLLASEVTFSDGSVWKWEDGRSPDINPELTKNATEALDCAKQVCVGRPSTLVKDAVTYSCGPSPNNERCSTNGDYDCLNQSCNKPGGGGGGAGDYEIILD